MPIKTLHITNAYHNASGGVRAFYRALIEAANEQGRLMRLIVPGERDEVEEVGSYGRIYHVAARRAFLFDNRYRVLMPPTYLAPFRGKLWRILRGELPDLIEVCDKYSVNWLGGLLRRGLIPGLRRPPLVGMSCERMDDNVRAFLGRNRAGRLWSRFHVGYCYIPFFDYHIANSNYTAAELRDAMRAGHERPVYVRPMGVEIDGLAQTRRSESSRRKLIDEAGGGEGTKLLLYAGRLSPEKNVPLLIDMIERLANDFILIIAGDGPLAGFLENEAKIRAPGRVRLLGHISERAKLLHLYADCDAFIHPNPREPFGIAPLEAMATGLPLVAPNAGGVLSYAGESNSWLAEPDGDSFAAAARAVFNDPAMRKDRLSTARWTARQYEWRLVADSFFKLYDDLIEQFPSSRFASRNNRPAAFPVPPIKEEYEQPRCLESHASPGSHAGERRGRGYWSDPSNADSRTGSRNAS
ncbi:MAG TPA: glycosyltransferase [Blastocatellia bacterium]|nr:glycosyltransferase [Blastocatellia bacterium]